MSGFGHLRTARIMLYAHTTFRKDLEWNEDQDEYKSGGYKSSEGRKKAGKQK